MEIRKSEAAKLAEIMELLRDADAGLTDGDSIERVRDEGGPAEWAKRVREILKEYDETKE